MRFFEPDHSHSHDTWLFDIGRLLDAREHIDQPLILYRRHDKNATESHATSLSQTSSWRRRLSRLKHVLKSDIFREVRDQLTLARDLLAAFDRNAEATIESFGSDRYNAAIATLKERESYLDRRLSLLEDSRIFRPWRIVKLKRSGGYSEGSSLGMIRDLLA